MLDLALAFAVGVVVGHKLYVPFMNGMKSLWAKLVSLFKSTP